MIDQYKIHETEVDRQRELTVINSFCSKRNMTFVRQPVLGGFDVMLYIRGTLRAIAEVKCRSVTYGLYKDFTIDASKMDHLREVADGWGVTPLLIVSFGGTIYYRRCNGWEFFETTYQKRRDRDERADPVYHIPWGPEWVSI